MDQFMAIWTSSNCRSMAAIFHMSDLLINYPKNVKSPSSTICTFLLERKSQS